MYVDAPADGQVVPSDPAPAPADGQVVTTFQWDGNSCFFDTFLEQAYWLRQRLDCAPPAALFLGMNDDWTASLEMMDAIHSLQHKQAENGEQRNKTRSTMMEIRTKLRNQICQSNNLKGAGDAEGDVNDMWYAVRDPTRCSPADPDVFGARMKSSPCMGCFGSEIPETPSGRPWTDMRMDNMAVRDAVALGLSTINKSRAYFGVDLWKSLQGYPRTPWTTAVKCPQCPHAYAYPMQIEGPRKVIMCSLARGEEGKPNSTQVYFREWESIIVGKELVSYKAIADGRLEGRHWTCVVDVNLASHTTEHMSDGTWHLMDDTQSDTPAALLDAGWTEYEKFRTIVIYVRSASRPLTEPEQALEDLRLVGMAARVERLRLEQLKKDMKQQRLSGGKIGDLKSHPIEFDSQ